MSIKSKIIILLLFLAQGVVIYWSYSDKEQAQEVELLPYKAYLENPLAVKSMDLSNLGLEEIIVDLSQFQNLEYLNLSDNSLQDIPKSLLKLPKLKTLLLANNGLSLPNNLIFYDNESIERLDLSNNYFSEITGAHCIPCLKNLKYLNLNGNNIQVMPDFTATEIDTILLQKNSIYDVSNISLRLPIKHIVKYLDLSIKRKIED